jgi:hypothetical protein
VGSGVRGAAVTAAPPPGAQRRGDDNVSDVSVGQLIGVVTRDLSTRPSAAGLPGYMTVLFLSLVLWWASRTSRTRWAGADRRGAVGRRRGALHARAGQAARRRGDRLAPQADRGQRSSRTALPYRGERRLGDVGGDHSGTWRCGLVERPGNRAASRNVGREIDSLKRLLVGAAEPPCSPGAPGASWKAKALMKLRHCKAEVEGSSPFVSTRR